MAKKQPFNPLLAAKLRDRRAQQASDGSAPTSPQTGPSKTNSPTSMALQTTTRQPQPPQTPSQRNVSVQEHTRTAPQRQPRNINDSSYRANAPAPQPGPNSRVVDQMTVAKTDPRYPQKTQANIDSRKSAREKFAEKGRNGLQALNSRQEHGAVSVFQNASVIEHRRAADGRNQNQESGRLGRASLNPRPGQRTHPTK